MLLCVQMQQKTKTHAGYPAIVAAGRHARRGRHRLVAAVRELLRAQSVIVFTWKFFHVPMAPCPKTRSEKGIETCKINC